MDRSTIPEQAPHREEPVRLGVSSCLLGVRVRYDGGHKHDRYITDVLGKFFEWVPVCPEFEIGLGVPRPTIQLQGGDPNPRLIEPTSGEDLTDRMESFAERRLAEIERLGLDGFILKSRSPSCGVERVKVFGQDDLPTRDGTGVFARAVIRLRPDLPVAENEWFTDPDRRREFLERVLGHHRKRVASGLGLDAHRLADLETTHRTLARKLSAKSSG